jgi:serine/threonine protein phosphatase PrpC
MTTDDREPPGDADTDRINARRRALLSRPPSGSDSRPLSASVKVEIAAGSWRGAARAGNDDHYLVLQMGRSQHTIATSLSAAELPAPFDEHGYVMLVADGLGEGGVGSVASRVALSTIAHIVRDEGQWSLRVDPQTASDVMERAQGYYGRADLEVFERSMSGPLLSGMATSLTTAFSAGDTLFVAHVGHSRAYMFRNGMLTRLTRDHTMATDLANSKGPVPVARRAQDLGHILTDAVGAGGGTPLVDVEQFRLMNGDRVLLCTNGLTDFVTEERIADVLALPRQPAEQCALLNDLAAQAHSEDNVTVVLAQYWIPTP